MLIFGWIKMDTGYLKIDEKVVSFYKKVLDKQNKIVYNKEVRLNEY